MIGNQLDPLGYAFGSGVAGGLQQMAESKLTKQDMDRFKAFVAAQTGNPMLYATMGPGAMMMGPQIAEPPVFPEMHSPFGRQMQAQYMQGQMANMMPLNPLQEAERQRLIAEAGYYDARTKSEGVVEYKPTDPRHYLAQGHSVADAMTAARRAANLEAGPTNPKTKILTNPDTGEQVAWVEGAPIPPGGPWREMGTDSGPQNVINFGDAAKEKTASINTQLRALDDLSSALDKAIENSRGSILSPTGPVSGWLQSKMVGVGMASDVQNELLTQMSRVANEVLQARSGVAISPPELARIEKEVPTAQDPPPLIRKKIELTRRNLLTLRRMRQEQGLSLDTGGSAEAPSLEAMSTEELLRIVGGK